MVGALGAVATIGASAVRLTPTVTITGPPGTDSLRDVTPAFTIATSNVAPAERPLRVRLQIDDEPTFTSPFLIEVDSLIVEDTAVLRPRTPLPAWRDIYWRAEVETALGESVASGVGGPRPVAAWLALRSPPNRPGLLLEDPRPTFVWSSSRVAGAPAPWSYDLQVLAASTGRIAISEQGLSDTTYTPTEDLEASTPYRWRITARLTTGEVVTVESPASFVIADTAQPLVTLLYQNFPNPFPTAATNVTCLWFDLARASDVHLEVYDLRGHRVRTLIAGQRLPAGQYGRRVGGGCDDPFSWDGIADDGRLARPGVYLLRLRAAGTDRLVRALFLGR